MCKHACVPAGVWKRKLWRPSETKPVNVEGLIVCMKFISGYQFHYISYIHSFYYANEQEKNSLFFSSSS